MSDPAEGDLRTLQVDVVSTSKPEPGPDRHTYRCDADIRIREGDHLQVDRARLLVHPSGWMGVNAGFQYELDAATYPTFEARAEQACLWTIGEFPSEDGELISVFLLGTGTVEFDD
jgi:hypothetical protein